jgi:ribosomal RNA-processing protein 7
MAKDKSKAKTGKKSSSNGLEEICGFKILPIHMNRGAIHYMYMKKHESRQDSEATPKDRTLFLLNLPVDTTDQHIKRLLKPHARIVSIKYHTRGSQQEEDEDEEEEQEEQVEEPKLTKKQKKQQRAEEMKEKAADPSLKIRNLLTTGSFAHVVVLETKELENVLNMSSKKREWDSEDDTSLPLGFDREYHKQIEWVNLDATQLIKHFLLYRLQDVIHIVTS